MHRSSVRDAALAGGRWRRLLGIPATCAVLALGACAGAPTGAGATAPGTARAATPPAQVPTSPSRAATTPAGPVSVVGLGDSVMAGAACDCRPFLERYAGALATRDRRTVVPTNLGVNGLTAPALVTQLGFPPVASQVAAADTVVVSIGANDLVPLVTRWEHGGCDSSCVAPRVDRMRADVAAVLARLRALLPDGQRVLVTDYWNVYEDGDVADALRGDGFADWSDGVTRQANSAICAAASGAGDTCVDLYQPFLGADGTRNPTGLLADDGDHPDSAGHDLIARTLLAATPPSGQVR